MFFITVVPQLLCEHNGTEKDEGAQKLCVSREGGKKQRVGTKNMEPQRLPEQPKFTGVCLRYVSAFLCYSRFNLPDLSSAVCLT
jgi:hypothetical protein